MNKGSKIYIAGHRGMVGSAILRNLREKGYENLLVRPSVELDLRDGQKTREFFEREKPEYVFMAAAKVGGIIANDTYRADFIYDNLMMESNVIHQSYRAGVKKLLFLGSSCIYPKNCPQPIREEYLLSGPLEKTNEPYAIAKIAGVKMCEAYRDQYGCDFISAMPTNLYGPNDNYHPKNSHVLPALLRRVYEAKQNNLPAVSIWGTGKPRREFLFADDLADACVFLMQNYSRGGSINVGSGEDISISELADKIKETIGYKGETVFDTGKPDGTFQKLMDVSKLHGLGWKARTGFDEGLSLTLADFVHRLNNLNER